MKVNIRGDKVEITPAIKEYIETKIAKLDPYFKRYEGIEAKVVVKIWGEQQVVEISVPTDNFTLRAEEANEDLYAAVDIIMDVLERQIRKNKSRLKRMRHAFPIEMDHDLEVPEVEVTEDNESKIVRRKVVDSKPMSEEEAILQMELLNHDFYLFRNVDADCVSVIYSRKDGQYGIINIK